LVLVHFVPEPTEITQKIVAATLQLPPISFNNNNNNNSSIRALLFDCFKVIFATSLALEVIVTKAINCLETQEDWILKAFSEKQAFGVHSRH